MTRGAISGQIRVNAHATSHSRGSFLYSKEKDFGPTGNNFAFARTVCAHSLDWTVDL